MNESSLVGDETKDLRKALQFAVCKIIFREDREQGTRTTESAIAALTELTFQYATKSLIPDLHIFSTHANRKSTISPDDVVVALRKLQPDQLEAFKRNFCRGGSKVASSRNNSSSLVNNGNEENKKTSVATAGRRRKRNETEVLSLSSSSTSSDDSDCTTDNECVHKQKAVGKYAGGSDPKSRASGAPTARRTHGNLPSLPMKRNTGGQKKIQRELLLNKFQLQSDHNHRRDKEDAFDCDTSSMDDNDMTRSSSRDIVSAKENSKVIIAATSANRSLEARKLSSEESQIRKRDEQHQAKKRPKRNNDSNKNLLLDDDDDSTDEDDIFLHINANKTKGMPDRKNDLKILNSFGGRQTRSKPNQIGESPDGRSDERRIDSRSERGSGGDSGARKQSQVAEVLANLSSDSGMDQDNSDDDLRINIGNSSSTARHRPRIQSDDDS